MLMFRPDPDPTKSVQLDPDPNKTPGFGAATMLKTTSKDIKRESHPVKHFFVQFQLGKM